MAFHRRSFGTCRSGRTKSEQETLVEAQLASAGVSGVYEVERLPYMVEKFYTPDFTLPNGVRIEVKGWFKPEDRTKLIAVKKAHPGLDLRLVFSNASKTLSKGSKTTYADWCRKHGFKFCEVHKTKPRLGVAAKSLPADWLK